MSAIDPISEWVVETPAPGIRPFVDRYIGYRMAGFAPGVHRGLPSSYMTFIVSVGSPINVMSQTSPTQSPAKYQCVLSGLQASAALIPHDGNQEGVAVELTPPGSRVLFGMPASELWDLSLELSDVAGRVGIELWERVQVAHGWRQRFDVCDDVLTRLYGEDRVADELEHCWRTLVGSGGRIPVTELASEVGYSRQHLARRFRKEFGLGPKLAARVVRFERARRMLTSTPPYVSLAQVAVACGYYDQAHLHRDFMELAGCTPIQLLAEHLPFFQDETAPAG